VSIRILSLTQKKKTIGHQVYSYLTLTTTNDQALKMARNGAKHGTIVVSRIQTKGRGRGNNIWYSETGGLYLSIILRPNLNYEQSLPLTLIIGLSVAQAIECITDLKVMTRWVNDLMINNNKVGGILLETETEADRPEFFIAGIGLNVNQTSFPADEPITSLRLAAKKKLSRWKIIQAICQALENNYQIFLKQGFSGLREEYKQRSSILNQMITIQVGAEKFKGKAVDIDEDGKLVLLTDQNKLRKFQAGHILL
jgi:BirA family biotin operon repressor/biotin-[acetyl-CoA-carboxylase] ligase